VSGAGTPRQQYLDRLTDLLPAREAARVREDVEALILERAAEEQAANPDVSEAEAERRALEALGTVEHLADELVSDPLTIPLATRRLFVRVLAVLFACHLLLSIVLTVAGSEAAAIPGLLGPLPKGPAAAVFLSVVTLFLIDTGLLLVLFVALGTGRSQRALRSIYVHDEWTHKGAIEGLVLLSLLAVILNLFLQTVFAVKHGDTVESFLSRDLLGIVPLANVVLGLFAVRHVLTLVGRGRGILAAGADALACLTGVAALIAAATQSELVEMPASRLGQEAADVLDDLLERALLIVIVVSALLLTVRFVRQAIRAWRLLRA
jgi:hypothetical protein